MLRIEDYSNIQLAWEPETLNGIFMLEKHGMVGYTFDLPEPRPYELRGIFERLAPSLKLTTSIASLKARYPHCKTFSQFARELLSEHLRGDFSFDGIGIA